MQAVSAVSKQTFLVKQSVRSFARTPMIRFLGPRSKTDKGVGMYASAASNAASADSGDKKALSRDCELEFADIPADRWARLPFSELECETINAGTNEIEMDWRNIRL